MSEMADWLSRIGLGQYIDAFQSNGVDLELLKKITNEDLKDMGIVRLADRKRLLEEVERMSVPPAPAVPSAPAADMSGNRRLLTVLFCDLVGSTELSTRLDPEELRDTLREYQRAALASISKFHGVLANNIGDGVMAYFGWPLADEDQARQAVRAGFDMIEAVGKIKLDGKATLRCRVGIASGRVVVGGGNQLDSAAGETLNLAARLQSVAEENCVVIERTTRHMLGPAFRTTALGAVALKGFQHPVEVWQATEEQKYLDRFDSHHEGHSQFVGRRDELHWLLLGWRNLDQGKGRTAVIRGEAGIGKSRLVREFEQLVRQQSSAILRFQCSPDHVNSAFYPVIQYIESSAHFDPHGEEISSKLEKLAKLFAEAIAEEPRFRYLLSDLIAIPHDGADKIATLTPAERRRLLIAALVANTVRLSRADPVLLILEDAHWIDPSSLEMLQELCRRANEERIFIIVTTRPGRELQFGGVLTELGLGRLSDSDVATIARGIVGDTGLRAQDLASIVERVEGVPLFAEELSSTLAERKADAYLNLPENIQASITARLDALGGARQTAQVASVIGRDFTQIQLTALAAGSVADLESSLEHLIRSGLVLVSRDQSYAFKHALVRDVAYESLLHDLRRQLHLRFARTVLADADRERTPELAAYHLTEGGAVMEALDYWKKAGYRASRTSAFQEAIAHFTKGLSLIAELKEGPERDRLELAFHVGIMGPLIATQGYTSEEMQSRVARALELAKTVTDAPEIFPALYGRWSFLHAGGFINDSFAIAREFSDLAERQGNRDALYARYRMLAGARLCLGLLDESQRDLEEALSLYLPEEHERLLTAYGSDLRVAAHCFLSQVLWLKGQSEKAIGHVESALKCARGIGHLPSVTMSLFFGGLISLLRRDCTGVHIYIDELMSLASRQAIGAWPAIGRSLLGWAQIEDGKFEAGLASMNEGMAQAKKIGIGQFVPIAKCALAEVLLEHGRKEDALPIIGDAETITHSNGHAFFEAEVRRLKAEFHAQSGALASVEPELRSARDVARRDNARGLELRVVLSHARFLTERGRRTEARDLLQEIVSQPCFDPGNPDLISARRLLDTLAAAA